MDGTSDKIFIFKTVGLLDNLNKKNDTLAVFIDLKKTFDTLDHKILREKLNRILLPQNQFETEKYVKYDMCCIEYDICAQETVLF